MKKYVDYLIKSIFAGVMIGIAGTVFLRVDNNIIGSFLFSIGLLVICCLLYTSDAADD